MSEDCHEAVGKPAALYPKTFFVAPEDRRPLKIGIYHDPLAVGQTLAHFDVEVRKLIFE